MLSFPNTSLEDGTRKKRDVVVSADKSPTHCTSRSYQMIKASDLWNTAGENCLKNGIFGQEERAPPASLWGLGRKIPPEGPQISKTSLINQ